MLCNQLKGRVVSRYINEEVPTQLNLFNKRVNDKSITTL